LEQQVSDKKGFDPKKFADDLRDQIHRGIYGRIDDQKRDSRRSPMVVGIALRGPGRSHGGVVTGAIFILIGLAFLLDHLGIISVSNLWRFWPMLVVLVGVLNFLAHRRPFGILWIFAGVLLQLNELGIAHFGWAAFWPMMLIAFGLLVMWGSFQWSPKPGVSTPASGDPRTTLNEAVVFGGLERRMTSQDFQGGDITAIFGGIELDLTEANMQADSATLAITAIFGGVEVRVPPSWQVAFRGAPIFGGVEDKTRTPRFNDPANPNPKTLVITGAVIFGGLEIKN
jgi:predicted membrane protein